MNTIYELNGFICIDCEDSIELPSWVTTDYTTGHPYFLLNATTKKLFIDYFGPMLERKMLSINSYLLEDIMSFEQNSPRLPECDLISEYKDIILKPHQIEAIRLMITHKRYAFFYGTGTGKTLISIFYLMSALPKNVLIVTPKKVVAQYQNECAKYLSEWYTFNDTTVSDYNIVVTNFESLHKVKYKYIDCLIIDESHKAKNYMSNINCELRKIAKICTDIYLFTGTPIDKQRSEIFPQLAILDSRVYPGKTKFNYRYFNIDDYHEPKSEKSIFKKELTQMINDYSFGVKTTSVVTLPEINYIKTPVPHPDYYDELYKERFLYIKTSVNKYLSVADTEAMLRIKLQEICSGFLLNTELRRDDNTIEYIDKKLKTYTLKYNALKELIESKTFESGIIFTCFDKEITIIKELLNALSIKYAVINGETSNEECFTIREQLKDKSIDIVIANVKCTNAGLDLYFINKVVFYSLPDSYITYHQCCSRIYRIGQVRDCYVYHLVCEDTIEELKYKLLSRKKSFTDSLFKAYKKEE